MSEQSRQYIETTDTILADDKLVRQSTVADLRRTLDKVPRRERGLDWLERLIYIYVLKREKERRTRALLRRMYSARADAGEAAKHDDFIGALEDRISPYSLTGHGVRLTFDVRDRLEVAAELGAIVSKIQTLGYQVFANSGTLLGAVRDGSLIGHDDDADFAVIVEGNTDAQVLDEFRRFHNTLSRVDGFQPVGFFSLSVPIIKLATESGVEVDMFPAWMRDGRMYVWPHTYGELSVDDVLPMGHVFINGARLPAPRSPERMLELNYGPEWKTPDASFSFAWDEAKIRFGSFLRLYRRGRKYRKFLNFLTPFRRNK